MQKSIYISIPWFLPAFKAGGPIQSVNNLINCYNDNINYKIICGCADVDGIKLKNINCNQWIKFNEYTDVYYNLKNPFQLIRLWREKLTFDYLYIIGIYSFKYNIIPLLFSRPQKTILSVRGMLHPGALSQKSFKKKIFLSFLKVLKIQNRITFHATDDIERKYIQNVFGIKSKISIANNYPQLLSHDKNTVPKKKGHISLISVALISPMKNYLLILKALKACKGNVEYHIVGAVKDHNYWNLCLNEIQDMPKHIKVVYHGEKEPDKVVQYLFESHVFILPSKSENYGHAIIEALSAGKPTITSHHTPWKKLTEKKAGFNVNLELIEIENAIQFFINQEDENYQLFSNNAHQYAMNAVDLNEINNQYKKLFSN